MENLKNNLKSTFFLMIFMLIQSGVFAQFRLPIPSGAIGSTDPGSSSPSPIFPSAGDDVCKATKLNVGLACQSFSNDTSTASTAPKPVCWANAIGHDVWFSFVATTRNMTVSTDVGVYEEFAGTILSDPRIAIYGSNDGKCTSTLSELGCDDNSGVNDGMDIFNGTPRPSRLAKKEMSGLIPGKNYFIRVDGDSNAVGNFCISVFDTYTPGSTPCEAQVIYPNNLACSATNGNTVINTTSSNSYQPLGKDYCGGDNETYQYGTWTTFTGSTAGTIVVTNLAPAAVDYTLFDGTCSNMRCIASNPVAKGGSVNFTGIISGSKYYILTTLQNGNTNAVVKTDLCISNTMALAHPPTERNEGGVAGGGGTVNTDQCNNKYPITVDQVYKTTTYGADHDGQSACSKGKDVWFTWKVPSTYSQAQAQVYFQIWNKNCTNGPGNKGVHLSIAPSILGDACQGNCIDFSNPKTADNTNISLDASKYGNQYDMVFSTDSGEVCDFNFRLSRFPQLPNDKVQGVPPNCKPTNKTINPKACDSYISPSGKIWTKTGTYRDTVTNVSGCDSVLTINLTIKKSTNKTFSVSVCSKYVSPSRKHVWRTSGIYKDTIRNVAGCDSLLTIKLTVTTLNITIAKSGEMLTSNAVGATYQWLDCRNNFAAISGATSRSFKPSATGTYAVALSDNGCTDTSARTFVKVTCYSHFTTTYNRLKNSFKLTADTATIGFASTYQWDFGDGTTSTSAAPPAHVYAKDTVYKACLKIKTASGEACNYCHSIGKDALGNIYKSGELNEMESEKVLNEETVVSNENSFVIFPNPTSGEAEIRLNQSLNSSTIRVLDVTGQTILVQTNVSGNRIKMDISNQTQGIYFIEVLSADGVWRGKLLKE